ncbi:MAG: hypothetical protein QE495_07580 [Acidovorax sp.]|uniref:hypothetical protein n=1 Tax=Acidovorax sp. TaxID=1872122 RepID=UPI0026329F40|nr:hypothetical protein [Acidovorax sp.]MDH4426297.1 hypothetical protein [Acidovorax sp.]
MAAFFDATGIVAVVLSLSEQPRVYAIADLSGSKFTLGTDVFTDSGAGDWLGFYDWLRSTSGDVIGVRLWTDEVNDRIRSLGRYEGVVADDSCSPLLIYFGAEREFDDVQSCDQDFGSNMLLVSSNGLALTFNSPTLK